MLKDKKILFLIFVMLLLFFPVVSFGATELITLNCNASVKDSNVNSITVPDFSHLTNVESGKYIISVSSNNYYLYILDDVYRVVKNTTSGKESIFFNSNNEQISVSCYKCYYKVDDSSSWASAGSTSKIYGEARENYVWNVDIYNSDGTLFFQGPIVEEQPEEVTAMTILSETTKTIPLSGVLQEIVTILPLIIVVVVSFLGLDKGLKLLLSLLHQA